jgi:hypothetical protein
VHVVGKVFFSLLEDFDFFVEAINNSLKGLFELRRLVKMLVPQGLILLIELVNLKLGLFFFQYH